MQVVATPIIISVMTSVVLRPMRSPRWPKITPPTGRARKPTQKVAKDKSVATPGSISFEKNSSPNTSEAASP